MKINNPNLIEQLDNLIKYVAEYESDTFSASARGITNQDAKKIVEGLLITAVQGLEDNLDGITLSESADLLD